MAFIITAPGPSDYAEINLLQNESELIGRICIGYDDHTGATYSAVAALVRHMGTDSRREIHFDIVEAYEEDGKELENWCKDGTETRRFLVGAHRKIVLQCICMMLQEMVKILQPEVIYMMTVTPHLPKKALHKYAEICRAIHEIGYSAGRGNPFHGTEVWLMERSL